MGITMIDSLMKEFTEDTGYTCGVIHPDSKRYIQWLQKKVFFHRNVAQKFLLKNRKIRKKIRKDKKTTTSKLR
jgi:hypothetical protein